MNRLAGCDVDSGQRISRGGGGWAMIAPRLRAERYAAESEEDLTMKVRVEEVGEKWTETKRKGKRKEKSRQVGDQIGAKTRKTGPSCLVNAGASLS